MPSIGPGGRRQLGSAVFGDMLSNRRPGLKVERVLETRRYRKGIKVGKAAMKSHDITGDQFRPEWNYAIRPRPS
jgi:hypothetical protein